MKYAILAAALFIAGCGDVNFTTTSSGGDSTPPEVVTVTPVVVQ